MIKINYKNTEVDKGVMNIKSIIPYYTNQGIMFNMDNNKHNLMVGDNIIMTKYYYDNGIKKMLCRDYFRVKVVNGDTTFIIYPTVNFSCGIINQSSEVDRTRSVTFDEFHCINPNDIKKYVSYGNTMKLLVNSGMSNSVEITNINNIDNDGNIYTYNDDFIASEIIYDAFSVIMPTDTYITDGRVYFPFTRYFFYVENSNGGEYILFDDVEITREHEFYSIPLFLESNSDYESLMQGDVLKENYLNEIEDKLMPKPYNMERVKYKPIAVNGEYIEGLIFNLHFREREKVSEDNDTTTKEWYIPEGSTKYWNTIKSLKEINNPENKYLYKSDLLGYLGFTINDIANQKMKIKKSFLRLSFYTSKDPLTQKLLFYSTIFMDSGKLYGKYLRCLKNAKKGNKTYSIFTENDNENLRLSSQFSVYDEYNTESSSEGYNLYLFEDDVPQKNRERDIYLKIEFNHAGYGRTIPLVLWNMENPEEGLTMNNYLDCLYIKVRIQYTNNGYSYVIPDVINDNNLLTFNLFEPRLEKLKE